MCSVNFCRSQWGRRTAHYFSNLRLNWVFLIAVENSKRCHAQYNVQLTADSSKVILKLEVEFQKEIWYVFD